MPILNTIKFSYNTLDVMNLQKLSWVPLLLFFWFSKLSMSWSCGPGNYKGLYFSEDMTCHGFETSEQKPRHG